MPAEMSRVYQLALK